MPRTNNQAEGWHTAYAGMTGSKRPTIFKFLDLIKKDYNLQQVKIAKCEAGIYPPKGKKKYENRAKTIKRLVQNYQNTINAEGSADDSLESSSETDEPATRTRSQQTGEITPVMKLLAGITHHMRL